MTSLATKNPSNNIEWWGWMTYFYIFPPSPVWASKGGGARCSTQVYTQAVSAIKAAGRRLPLAQTTVEDPPTKFSHFLRTRFFFLSICFVTRECASPLVLVPHITTKKRIHSPSVSLFYNINIFKVKIK